MMGTLVDVQLYTPVVHCIYELRKNCRGTGGWEFRGSTRGPRGPKNLQLGHDILCIDWFKKITNCLKVAFLRPTEPLVDNYKAAEQEEENRNEDKAEQGEGKEDKNEDKLELEGTSDEADAVRSPRSLNK